MSADPNALAGLRRLVLHSRDGLRESRQVPPPTFTQLAHRWSAAEIRRHAQVELAIQVLTLVADCLPEEEAVTA